MTASDIIALIELVLQGRPPGLPEPWINDWQSRDRSRRLHEACRANSKESIGAVVELHRRWEYPPIRRFAELYLRSGDELDAAVARGERPSTYDHGRSAMSLARIVINLTRHCQAHPNHENARYDDASVGEWFLHLLLVRTLEGSRREGRVWRLLGGERTGWRPSTPNEDSNEGLDFVHTRSGNVVQVKPPGWEGRSKLLGDWLIDSARHGDRRWLVQCDPAEDGPIKVSSILCGRLIDSNPGRLQAAGNQQNKGIFE